MKQIPVILLVLCAAVISTASAGTVVNYQGMLKDSSGKPITTTGDIVFSLYDVTGGGTPLDTDTHVVTVTDGLFTTALDFDPQYYDGRGLWLEISIRGEVLSPRQEFRPVPYALSLVPGATVEGTLTTPMLALANNEGAALLAYATGDRSSGEEGVGVYSIAEGEGGFGVYGAADGIEGIGVVGVAIKDNSYAVYAETVGYNSPAIYGISAQDVGVYGEGKEGGFFTTNGAGADYDHLKVGVNISTYFDYNTGIQTRTTGDHSTGVSIETESLMSYGMNAVTAGNYSTGMRTITQGYASPGVVIHTFGGTSVGLHADTQGPDSPGITGTSKQARGLEGYTFSTNQWVPAIYGSNEGAGDGVYGLSQERYGVYGKGKEGGYFTTNGAGTSVNRRAGVNVSTVYDYNRGARITTLGNYSDGIFASTEGDNSVGIGATTEGYNSYGIFSKTTGERSNGMEIFTKGYASPGLVITTTNDYSSGISVDTFGSQSYGIVSRAQGPDVSGIYAFSAQARGIEGYTESTNEWVPAVYGKNMGAGDGVYGVSNNRYGTVGVSETSHAIYADTKRVDHMYGVYTPDYMYAAKYDGGGADIAEYAAVRGEPEAGTVLVIGADGILEPATSAYDTSVAGIVSTAPGVSLGTKEHGNDGEALVALAGRVPCRVDASYGAIYPGDVLTTSPTAGHAMKAVPVDIGGVEIYRPSTVLGKALGTLEAGTGTIEVLVTLQ
ncbi:MAG: hypothetical protein GKC04_07735 [Methanomicrobiales archaeon]|nr:hypothetical protein [Methanomicrobiales archaeon]